ncbi:MAG: serine hydrolase domain-containing protein [Pseudomonadota bacterium]
MIKAPVTLATFLAICAIASPAQAADSVEDRIARVENGLVGKYMIKGKPVAPSKIAERMATMKVPGLSVAVINNGAIEWARGYGVVEAGGKQAVTTDTLFQAASISKPVAAMGALRLVEQGTLSLDQDINAKLTTWKIPAGAQTAEAPVTLRNLLNHSAGTTVHGFRGYAAGEEVPSVLQLLDGAKPANSAPVRVERKPGEGWKYSGGGISIAQLAMSSAAGKAFAPLMKDSVLDPVGMKNSTFEQPLPASLHAAAASGHNNKGEPIKGKWHTYPEQAAAGLWTTPSDLARFALELQNASAGKSNKVISKAMAAQMLTRLKGTYGLGIDVGNAQGMPTFSHGGSNAGFRTMMFAFTSTGQGAVVMTNGDNGGALTGDVLRSIAAVYGWTDWRVTEKEMAKVDSKMYANYAGNYEIDGKPVSVLHEGERLLVSAPMMGLERMELYPASETTYFDLVGDATYAFEKDEAGKFDFVIKLGSTRRAKRVP